MTEENKYYTPSIEEFHVGFEFEFSGLDNHWNSYPFEKQKILRNEKEYFGLFTLDWVQKIFNGDTMDLSQCIRVKYLDKEDIEACGWKNPVDYQNITVYHNADRLLVHYAKDNIVGISEVVGSTSVKYEWDTLHYLFNGKIKNKSELLRIMKMVGYETQISLE